MEKDVQMETAPALAEVRKPYYRKWTIALAGGCFMLIVLACVGTYNTMQVAGLPQYTCPSSTPRPTSTAYPTSLPTYPTAFQADLDYYFVDPVRSTVFIQYMGQSVGPVNVTLSGIFPNGSPWSGGTFQATYFAPGTPGWASSYPVSIPLSLQAATIRIVATYYVYNFPVAVYLTPQPAAPRNPGPSCCIPNPIYPTPVPTYTPYPTPTEYIRQNDYFIGDWIYDLNGTKLGYKVTSIESRPTNTLGPSGLPQTMFVWTLSIKNRGTREYNVFPAAQSYVSEIVLPSGESESGFWGTSVAAGLEAKAGSNYDMVSIEPGQTHDFLMAAYGPVGQARRIGFALDFTARPTPGDIRPGATQVAGRNVVIWLNEVNTICKGDIREP